VGLLACRLNAKPQYSYDSDEEIDSQGTWEHKKRAAEMKKTALQVHVLAAIRVSPSVHICYICQLSR
jgi:hypothetical protein